jgi:uncharacterized protein
MQDDEFEWLDAKAVRNWRDHDVSFEMARDVFKDIFAVEWADDGQDEGEDRFVTVGMVENRLAVCLVHLSRREDPDHFGEIGGTL